MLKVTEIAFSCYAVTDMARARKFYEEVLGLKPTMIIGEHDERLEQRRALAGQPDPCGREAALAQDLDVDVGRAGTARRREVVRADGERGRSPERLGRDLTADGGQVPAVEVPGDVPAPVELDRRHRRQPRAETLWA